MARREATIHPLPDWFALSNYGGLFNLPNEWLIDEVRARVVWLHDAKGDDRWLPGVDFWQTVVAAGATVTTRVLIDHPGWGYTPVWATRDHQAGSLQLPLSRSIYPIDWLSVGLLYECGRRRGIYPGHDELARGSTALGGNLATVGFESVACHAPFGYTGGIQTSIALEGFTDAEILADLAELLPKWRKQLNQPEPNKKRDETTGRKRQSEDSVIKRVIEYRIIPMLDLMIWAKINDFKYTDEQLSRALYPDELVTAKKFAETRRARASDFEDEGFVDMVRLWLNQTDRGTGKRNGDRLVKDTIAGTG